MARPRAFDPDTALEDIMNLFWERGYEATSLQDIEAATGLNKQSLYRAFGDKRAMYLKALDLYEAREVAAGAALLRRAGTARERLGRLFGHAIAKVTEAGDRRGCFLCNAGIDQAYGDPATATKVGAILGRVQTAIEGALTADAGYADADARRRTALALMAGYFGLRALVKAGMPVAALEEARDRLLQMI